MPSLSKVLIANRGEIAVRIARACADAGLTSVAVYAEDDRNSLHVRICDEAFALDGRRAQETYLDANKILEAARHAGADAVHPGYGFLSESAQFAQAVIDAGLIWIGPPPAAIDALGDKVRARQIAMEVGAPLVPGTPGPVSGAQEVADFVASHGLPIAIKAVGGGGGRGLKVVRDAAEITEAYESAVRESEAAFGRGDCFVERYLDHPRHVETQCLADGHGTVVVVSTRDCSLQRRHQKLVEEAPAPFLTQAQHSEIERASKAILLAAGYVGAGTCEFLIGADGSISFLEVNTRLQVEHPVTEEVTGIDLVLEQFRIAAGEALGYDRVEVRGHAFEFRLNGEDPAAGFLPAPGTITTFRMPGGPGVRIDSGVESGDTVCGLFDSLLAKIVVFGADRDQALARARRALRELKVIGVPTVLPFHRAVVREPAFTAHGSPFSVHTRWIETEFADRLGSMSSASTSAPPEMPATERVVVEVGGKRLEVVLPAGLGLPVAAGGAGPRPGAAARRAARRSPARMAKSDAQLSSPMQGTIVKVAVSDGDLVKAGDLIVVLEAMKMEQPIVAHRDGRVTDLRAEVGGSIATGAAICQIESEPSAPHSDAQAPEAAS